MGTFCKKLFIEYQWIQSDTVPHNLFWGKIRIHQTLLKIICQFKNHRQNHSTSQHTLQLYMLLEKLLLNPSRVRLHCEKIHPFFLIHEILAMKYSTSVMIHVSRRAQEKFWVKTGQFCSSDMVHDM